MLVLAIWLTLIGYAVAITGKRNLGVSYKPQSDGSIKPVDANGNEARTYSLLDVVTCGEPSGKLQGQQAPQQPGIADRSGIPGLPNVKPLPLPGLNPAPVKLPRVQIPNLGLSGRSPQPRVPGPVEDVWSGLKGLERTIAVDVYNGIDSLAGGLRDVLGGVHWPDVQWPTPRPQP